MNKPRPRDLVETREGLWFAVTEYYHPKGRVIAFLRYVPRGGGFVKVSSVGESYRILEKYPQYVLNEEEFGVRLQAVPVGCIRRVLRPEEFLRGILEASRDVLGRDASMVAGMLSKASGVSLRYFGLTGSVLAGANEGKSDLDLVVYGLENFRRVRGVVRVLIEIGKLERLSEDIITRAYLSRGYSRFFSLDEFRFHILRKDNSFMFNRRKVDLLCVRLRGEVEKRGVWRYQVIDGPLTVKALVIDDRLSFDFPAVYKIKAENKLKEIVSYRNAYAGQARKGEMVEARGMLEEVREMGKKPFLRLVLGTLGESGEYLKLAV